MRITVVIPSFNQAKYLEATLRSVLDQAYPNCELIVIDGGSTDGSVEIIKKYSSQIAYWVSEKDRGQAHAINKGLSSATGEVWSYLNSDDLLCEGALQNVSSAVANSAVRWFGGVSEIFDDRGKIGFVKAGKPASLSEFIMFRNRPDQHVFPCSNVSFMRRDILSEIGLFDESYHYGMDAEYYTRAVFQAGIRPALTDVVLGRWRWHSESKTMKVGLWYGFAEDQTRIAQKYLNHIPTHQRGLVEQEIQRQKKRVAVQRASYLRHRGELVQCLGSLLRSATAQPSLVFYRPWLGTLLRVCCLRRGNLALG